MFEGMVQMAGYSLTFTLVVITVHMSGLPSVGAGDPAECHCDNAAGYVP